MLLGQRGSGRPLRVALFAGIDDYGSLDGIAAISRLLVQTELNPGLARDFALFAYPLVNAFEHREPRRHLDSFARRYSWERPDADIAFFRSELRKWRFDALITLRTLPRAETFHATVRGRLLASEVVRPAIDRVSGVVPSAQARGEGPSVRYARPAGRLRGGPPHAAAGVAAVSIRGRTLRARRGLSGCASTKPLYYNARDTVELPSSARPRG